jgi:phosphoglycerate dehydrogenase-like enzyme
MNKTVLAVIHASVLSTLMALAAHAADNPAKAPEIIQQYGLEEAPTAVSERAGWHKPKRVLVGGFIPGLAEALRSASPDVEIITATGADAAEQAKKVDAVIGLCTPQILAAGKSIQWVQMLTAGVEQCVGIAAVSERNILVTNMQRIGGPIIAEHVMAMVLAFTRGLDLLIPAQARGEWRREQLPQGRMTVVQGKTMLVVGLGGIGGEVAKRAHALGMRVIATRASGRTGPEYVSYVGLPDELLKLAAGADFVVNAAPLTPQTTGIFDAAFFGTMQPSAYFINIARGRSVVTDALIAALKTGKIAGAGLDVTDPEPLPAQHPLWQAPNVIITPHVASDSDLGAAAQIAVVKENLRRYAAGERMLSVVDVSRGY